MKETLKIFGKYIPLCVGMGLVSFGAIHAINRSYDEGRNDGKEEAEFTNEAANFLNEMGRKYSI